MTNNKNDKNAKKKPDEEEELDVDGLLDDLKANIIEVYRNLNDNP